RALPDAEITAGTPIPAVVPLPELAMAPMPAPVEIVDGQVKIAGEGNPGFPFFIPGVAGHRPPHPPLDTIDDGGLPRHIITGGETVHVETRLDFTKEIEVAEARPLDEAGEPIEKVAMAAHAQRQHPSFLPDGTPASFIYNGLPPVAGAPFADPCIDDAGQAVGVPRTYKAAAIQLDVIFNKIGWHFPQQRILSLWEDVAPTFAGERAPEPLFFRANTNDCIEYQHTNLVPNIYELDDFQVRTPTDILGQHIHLVKFDVTASDGAGNGWNYEDGTFSPDEVRERIHAIRAHNSCSGDEIAGGDPRDGTFECPVAEAHPFFGAGPDNQFVGAQTTVQRWFADDVLNNAGDDRTLRTVFTHDHFGPSTHQQAGLYAGLVVEPEGSTWRHPETGVVFGSRDDGGPTSWRADILTADAEDSYREFLLEYADFALAYETGSQPGIEEGRGPTFPKPWEGVARQPGEGFDNPAKVINPPALKEVGLPFILAKAPDCPGGVPLPCPEAVSAEDPGTMNVNYRNEPVATRVYDPSSESQAAGAAGDLARVFSSQVERADSRLNVQPDFYPPLTPNVGDKDPFTPLLQAYESDQVQIRILLGAHEEGHNISINGIKWLFEPSDPNSGYRNSQMLGISEHFEFEVPFLFADPEAEQTDYLWTAGSSTDDLWNGLWGLLRVFRGDAPPSAATLTAGDSTSLLRLPNNPGGTIAPAARAALTEGAAEEGICPASAPKRSYSVVAKTAADLLPGGRLEYNSRPGADSNGPLNDPTAILYVLEGDLDPATGQLRSEVPIEPLVLRAAAGDCIVVTLTNSLPEGPLPDLDGFATLPTIIEHFNMNQVRPSHRVGLHPQLVAYNPRNSDGIEAGLNPADQAPAPGETVTYTWYAGDVAHGAGGEVVSTPIEFGAVNLMPADRIKHPNKGLIGALIIEPEGSTWVTDDDPTAPIAFRPTRTMATVTKADGSFFREHVVLFQNNINLRFGDGSVIPNTADAEDAEDAGQKAINYRTEPMWFRLGFDPDTPLEETREFDFSSVLSSAAHWDPETPIFPAAAGTPVRFRVLHPGGAQRNNVFEIHGHVWQQEPYTAASTQLGDNPLSLWEGARMGHGPSNHFDALLENGAGGKFGVTGDYLFRDHASFQFDGGIWGIFWVVPKPGEAEADVGKLERTER
ncbi:MAG: copper oxidase, partial [Acidobacteriota bacterium]